VAHALKQELPGYSVKNWKEIAPELGYADELLAVSLLLVMAIIMLALMFGIINNMLMSILERRRELGMLQAIGMNKPRIFSMIVIETIFIGLVAGPIGMLLGWLTISYFGNVGIDLSIFGQGLESFGISTQIYPELDAWFYGAVAAMVFAMALLASVYPAVKALRLNPVQAIRAI
jgi:ABC-type lipoprotein release transport system permease subunit